MRVALKIAYLGNEYYGFQRQPGLKTVEGEILSALKSSDQVDNVNKCGFGFAGRTDRGVHALGNVITFLTIDKVIINQINDKLPRSIRILAQANVPTHFKARYALQRHYRYLWPLITEEINLDIMYKAAALMEGTHDFTNFSKKNERNPVRSIDKLEIKHFNGYLQFEVFGESFLWNMVRKMVAALIMVGEGSLSLDDLDVLFNPSKEVAIRPVPPEGLILMNVSYSDVCFKKDAYAEKSFYSFLKDNYLKYECTALAEKRLMENLK